MNPSMRTFQFSAPLLVQRDLRIEACVAVLDRLFPRQPFLVHCERAPSGTLLAQVERMVGGMRVKGGVPSEAEPQDLPRIDVCLSRRATEPGHAEGSHLRVTLQVPAELAVGREAEILQAFGDGLAAWWGCHRTVTSTDLVADSPEGLDVALYRAATAGLLAGRVEDGAPHPEVPEDLEWLNYWSATTLAALGLSETALVEAVPGLVQGSDDSGAWLVQLTASPLDLADAEHREALWEVYARLGLLETDADVALETAVEAPWESAAELEPQAQAA